MDEYHILRFSFKTLTSDLVSDLADGYVVLFGGSGSAPSLGDTWAFVPLPPFFTHAKLHWTHHLVIPTTGGVQSWTVVVDNPNSGALNLKVHIMSTNTAYSAGSTLLTAEPGVNKLRFTTPVSGSFIGAKICFTATITWGPTGTENTSPGEKSGCFAVT